MDYFVLQAILEFIIRSLNEALPAKGEDPGLDEKGLEEPLPPMVLEFNNTVNVCNIVIVSGKRISGEKGSINADECLGMIEGVEKAKGGFEELFKN